jgi:hypothetical protein
MGSKMPNAKNEPTHKQLCRRSLSAWPLRPWSLSRGWFLCSRAGYVLTVEAVKLPYIYIGAIIFIDLFRYNVELIGSLE